MRNVAYTIIDGTTIKGTVVSKGETFEAEAKLCPGDNFSETVGKLIVKYRLEVQQRKRDLANTDEVIARLQLIQNTETKLKPKSKISKHWMRFIQEACEERKSQMENISFAKAMIEILSSCGSTRVEDMIRNIVNSNYKNERKSKLLIALVKSGGINQD